MNKLILLALVFAGAVHAGPKADRCLALLEMKAQAFENSLRKTYDCNYFGEECKRYDILGYRFNPWAS